MANNCVGERNAFAWPNRPDRRELFRAPPLRALLLIASPEQMAPDGLCHRASRMLRVSVVLLLLAAASAFPGDEPNSVNLLPTTSPLYQACLADVAANFTVEPYHYPGEDILCSEIPGGCPAYNGKLTGDVNYYMIKGLAYRLVAASRCICFWRRNLGHFVALVFGVTHTRHTCLTMRMMTLLCAVRQVSALNCAAGSISVPHGPTARRLESE